MPTYKQILKADILKTAYDITAERGVEAATATEIAKKLKCSIHPIYYEFSTMDKLRDAIIEKAMDEYATYLRREIPNTPKVLAVGENYFGFARKYPQIFRLIFTNARKNAKENIRAGIETNKQYAVEQIQKAYGLNESRAEDIYIQMGLMCQGIALGMAAGTASLTDEEYKRHLTTAFAKLLRE